MVRAQQNGVVFTAVLITFCYLRFRYQVQRVIFEKKPRTIPHKSQHFFNNLHLCTI